jgi:apolipoprotein N-acyltransferase
LQLILWPESSFDSPHLLSDFDEKASESYFIASNQQLYRATVDTETGRSDVPLLSGGSTHDPANKDIFNSALLFSTDGRVVDRYDKSHLVLFGEYVPFAEWFPVLDSLTPIGKGLSRGDQFRCMEIGGVKLAPSVCFESCVPHYIRRQVNTLSESGDEPDVLVNLTNDGWFFGTSCLDLHLASNVFRAVEMRKPHLVCANTGFSAEIDACGRLLQTGPRREQAVLRADIRPIERTSLYRAIGDCLPIGFAGMTLLASAVAVFRRRSLTKAETTEAVPTNGATV